MNVTLCSESQSDYVYGTFRTLIIFHHWKNAVAICRQSLHEVVSTNPTFHLCTNLAAGALSAAPFWCLPLRFWCKSLLCVLVCSSWHNLCAAPFLISTNSRVRLCAAGGGRERLGRSTLHRADSSLTCSQTRLASNFSSIQDSPTSKTLQSCCCLISFSHFM